MLTSEDKKALHKFGKQLHAIRKQKKLSLSAMAARCNVDNSKIAKIEKGAINIGIATIIKLARGLDIHPKELFDCNFD